MLECRLLFARLDRLYFSSVLTSTVHNVRMQTVVCEVRYPRLYYSSVLTSTVHNVRMQTVVCEVR